LNKIHDKHDSDNESDSSPNENNKEEENNDIPSDFAGKCK